MSEQIYKIILFFCQKYSHHHHILLSCWSPPFPTPTTCISKAVILAALSSMPSRCLNLIAFHPSCITHFHHRLLHASPGHPPVGLFTGHQQILAPCSVCALTEPPNPFQTLLLPPKLITVTSDCAPILIQYH